AAGAPDADRRWLDARERRGASATCAALGDRPRQRGRIGARGEGSGQNPYTDGCGPQRPERRLMNAFPTPAEFRREALSHPPDERGCFGRFGGRFVPETLMPALLDLVRDFRSAMNDDAFLEACFDLLGDYVGRPSRITRADNFGRAVGAEVWLKREDLN